MANLKLNQREATKFFNALLALRQDPEDRELGLRVFKNKEHRLKPKAVEGLNEIFANRNYTTVDEALAGMNQASALNPVMYKFDNQEIMDAFDQIRRLNLKVPNHSTNASACYGSCSCNCN